jgi:tetratricopeptide (TPR) repeat protein
MSLYRILGLSLFALSLGIVSARPAAGSEPSAPIPPPARDRYDAGQDLQSQGKLKEAVAAYEEAVRLGMEWFPRLYLKEGAAFTELKDYDAAVARYTKLIDQIGLENSCRY